MNNYSSVFLLSELNESNDEPKVYYYSIISSGGPSRTSTDSLTSRQE